MKEITLRFIAIYNHLIETTQIKNASDFAKNIDIGTSLLNEILKGRSNVGIKTIHNTVKKYHWLNLNWIITGDGKMHSDFKIPELIEKHPNEEYAIKTLGIPLLPIDALAGIASGEVSILELDCERYVVPDFKGADFLIPVKGSSMSPKYSSGDIVACKWLPLTTFFQWNKVYVLDTIQGPLIKRILKGESEDSLTIVSENQSYPPYQLPKSEIRKLAIVIGVIRLE